VSWQTTANSAIAELGELEPGGTLARCGDELHAVIIIAIEIKCSAE